MYIPPDSTVYLIKNCPLDAEYHNTLFFSSKTEQLNYFLNLPHIKLDKVQYIRDSESFKVPFVSEKVGDYNYIVYNNTNFSDKWFFGFVISPPEYIGTGTSKINYKMDIMQTTLFDYKLLPSFVEREHSATDEIGDNILDEPVSIGEYVEVEKVSPVDINFIGFDKVPSIVLCTTFEIDYAGGLHFDKVKGDIVNNVYSGLNFKFFRLGSDTDQSIRLINNILGKIVADNKLDGVVSMFMSPYTPNTNVFPETLKTFGTYSFYVPKYKGTLGLNNGYTPKNNKMYTAPFNILHCYSDNSSKNFRYEFFNRASDTCRFDIKMCVAPNPSLTLIPLGYGSKSNEFREEMRLEIENFPQCSFTTDIFKMYLGQNSATISSKLLSSAIETIPSIPKDNPPLLDNLNLGGIIRSGGQIIDMMRKAPKLNGTQTALTDYALGFKDFTFSRLTVTADYAETIDNFFTLYGYQTNRVKIPNRNVRPHWTYTKTSNCNIKPTGYMSCDMIAKVKDVYNNGITFWKNGDEIGNYNLNNGV